MQSQCGFEVLKLLTEGIGEPCKAPDLHAHSQVMALHAVCGDMLLIGVQTGVSAGLQLESGILIEALFAV